MPRGTPISGKRQYEVKSCGKAHQRCKICNPKYRATKESNPMKSETKKKIGIALAGRKRPTEVGKKISRKLKGRVSPTKGSKDSDDRKKRKSDAAKLAYLEGRRTVNFGSQFSKPIQYRQIWFRSRMEASFARWLDLKKIKWAYEPKRFPLSDGSSYLPDFYLPLKKVYVEVKGRIFEDGIRRMNLFIQEYNQKVIFADTNYFRKMNIDRKW